jgi:ABC-type nitrate/sulfonate/bicarbonate transport system permease component
VSSRPVAPDTHPDPARGTAWLRAAWSRVARYVEPALTVLLFVAIFEICAVTHVAGKDVMPTVPQIASAFGTDVTHAEVWNATWITVRSWLLGMAIVIVGGVPLGFLLGSSRSAYHGSHLLVEILRTVPSIAALPFLVLLYGIGTKLTVILVVLAALWPLLLQTMAGARDVDPVARDTGRSYGLSAFAQLRKIVLPSSLPYIATGIRISATIGLLLAIGTSLYAGGQGLGNEIMVAQGEFKVPLLFARVFFAGLLGLVVYYALISIERRALAWHPAYRSVP